MSLYHIAVIICVPFQRIQAATMHPKISVIIPCFNAERTIFQALLTVLQQSFQAFEIIVIDDGSSDRTLAEIGKISSLQIQVFSQMHQGASAARNRGITEATGGYIAFLDSDDRWDPGKLAAQYAAAQAHPECGLIYSWVNHVDCSGGGTRPASRELASGSVMPMLIQKNFLDTASNPLIRKDLIDRINGFDSRTDGAEDWDLFLRLAQATDFLAIPEVHVYYTVKRSEMGFYLKERGAIMALKKATLAAPSVAHLARDSRFNFYAYLTYRALLNPGDRQTSLTGLLFLIKAVLNRPSLTLRRAFYKSLIRGLVLALLPPSWESRAGIVLNRFRDLSSLLAATGQQKAGSKSGDKLTN